MPSRSDLAHDLQGLVGDALELEDIRNGWPALATLNVGSEPTPLALFVAPIGLSHRDRDDTERRFQNPGNVPIVNVPGRYSILVGLWTGDEHLEARRPVVALAEASRRDDGRETRWSVFLQVEALLSAANTGWAVDVSSSGERMLYAHPSLLPVAIETYLGGAEPSDEYMYRTILSTELLDAVQRSDGPSRGRVRRTVNSLVRDSRFSGAVLSAYDSRCAMCEVSLGLVQGAHIYPASAPGSTDSVANGIALCANHHLAFDRYLIGVVPDSLDVIFHPDVLELGRHDPAARRFVDHTLPSLRLANRGHGPDPLCFERRYSYYADQYQWFGDFSDFQISP